MPFLISLVMLCKDASGDLQGRVPTTLISLLLTRVNLVIAVRSKLKREKVSCHLASYLMILVPVFSVAK